jgi:hypothetical protein
MRSTIFFALILAVAGCEPNPKLPQYNGRIEAARALTDRYAHSRLAAWDIRVRVAGRDCNVLLVDTAVIMHDSAIEALHYGGGTYGIDGRGVEHFRREQHFRGVAYRDPTARLWRYDVSVDEAETLKPCG